MNKAAGKGSPGGLGSAEYFLHPLHILRKGALKVDAVGARGVAQAGALYALAHEGGRGAERAAYVRAAHQKRGEGAREDVSRAVEHAGQGAAHAAALLAGQPVAHDRAYDALGGVDAGYGDVAARVGLQPREEPAYILLRMRRGPVFDAGEQRGLGDVGRYHVRAGAEAAEGGGHALVEAGVKLAVVGHGGVAYHKRVRPGEQADNLLKQQLLLRRGEIAGVYPVELYAVAGPVPGYRQHLPAQVAAGPAGEFARVRAQERGGYAGALHARRGDDGERHGERALPEAGYVVHGAEPFQFWKAIVHKRYFSTLSGV